MLNNSGESGYPCLVPDLRGNAFSFSPLSIFFTVGLLYMAFIMLRQCRRCGFDSWVKNIPWRRKRQPTPVFLPGKSHGQRSLACYSPWGRKRVGHNLVTKRQQCSFCAYFLEGFYHNKHMKDAQHCSLFSSVQFSRSVVSNSLRPHESQQVRPPCPSPTPGVHSNSRTEHMKRCSTLLIIRENQIKTIMSYHLTLIRLAINKKSTNSKCWKGVEKREPSCTVGGM